jgi:hypothetical protein
MRLIESAEETTAPPVLYRVDASAFIPLNAEDDRALNALFASIKQRLGSNIRSSCWPYRQGRQWGIGLDLWGDAGEVTITLRPGFEPRLPGVRGCTLPLTTDDWRVSDGIDAFYLVSALLAVLDTPSGSDDKPHVGLKRVR